VHAHVYSNGCGVVPLPAHFLTCVYLCCVGGRPKRPHAAAAVARATHAAQHGLWSDEEEAGWSGGDEGSGSDKNEGSSSDEGGGGTGKRRCLQAGMPAAASQGDILAAMQAACAAEALALVNCQVGTRPLLMLLTCLLSK
jgi:hypothetical protein